MPGFQTKPLTITIVSGNDSRIFPRNVMVCFTHVLSQSWFWAVKIRNSPLMFFQTCAKLPFCLTQIYFLAITAWYRVYSMCFLISRNAIISLIGFRKNMSQCLKGFQGNLDITIFKNSPDWFRNSLNVRDYCKTLGNCRHCEHSRNCGTNQESYQKLWHQGCPETLSETLSDIGTYFCETQGSRSDWSENTCCILYTMRWLRESISESNKTPVLHTSEITSKGYF